MTTEKKGQEKELHESITVQGLSHVFDRNSTHARRIIWLFILCGGIGFTAFNIYNQVTLYLSAPVSIRVDQRLARRLLFPTVTICNNNFVVKSAIIKTGLAFTIPKFLPYRDFKENLTKVNFSEVDFDAIYSSEHDKQYQVFTHSLKHTVIRCEWESDACSLDNFTVVFTRMNDCISFNVNGTLMSRNSGRSHGFRVLLNVHGDEYFRSLDGFVSTGFMVAVHSSEVLPIMSEIGIAVAPGFEHFFGVDVQCQSSVDGINGCGTRPLNFTSATYSREACRLQCLGMFLFSKCGCTVTAFPNEAPVCDPVQFHTCYSPALKKYPQTRDGCEEDCPEPCSFTRYTTQHSSAPLAPNYLTAYTEAKGRTEEYWRRNMVILEVYLSSMSYQMMVKRLSYEILDLFCDIGGALGLLLGASILTMVEIVDILVMKFVSGVRTEETIA